MVRRLRLAGWGSLVGSHGLFDAIQLRSLFCRTLDAFYTGFFEVNHFSTCSIMKDCGRIQSLVFQIDDEAGEIRFFRFMPVHHIQVISDDPRLIRYLLSLIPFPWANNPLVSHFAFFEGSFEITPIFVEVLKTDSIH